MSSYRRLVVLVLLAAAASSFVTGTTYAWAQQTLRIGELAALTGANAPWGTQLHNARLLAMEEINARGGVNVAGTRYKLELVHLDVASPGEAIKVFERLLSLERVSLILDGAYSSAEYALGPVLKTKKALMMWSGGSDPKTTVGIPNAFRNNFDGGTPLTTVTAGFLKKMGVKRVATYGQTGHSEFKQFVEEYLPKIPGVEVVAAEWYQYGEKDFFPILTKLKGLKPDAIIVHGFFPDGQTLLKQAREIGLFPGPVWLSQTGSSPIWKDEAAAKIFEGTYEGLLSSFGMTTEAPQKSQRYYQAYARKYGEKAYGFYAESGYDSVHILAKALEKAGTVDDIPKIIRALQDLTTDEIPELLLLYKPGKLFDSDRQAYPKIVIVHWRDGKLVPVHSDYGK